MKNEESNVTVDPKTISFKLGIRKLVKPIGQSAHTTQSGQSAKIGKTYSK